MFLMALSVFQNYSENAAKYFLFFILYMCDMHNVREENKLRSNFFVNNNHSCTIYLKMVNLVCNKLLHN